MYGGVIEAEGGFTLEFGSRQDDPGFLWADLASLQSPPSHVALPFSGRRGDPQEPDSSPGVSFRV